MAKRIITISREFGSGGRFIGEKVAKKLGIAYYDKNIINDIAEKSGLSPEYVQKNAELSPKKGLFAYAFAGRDITGKSVEDMVYEAQRKVILELADKESCVIIGRNADYILKDRDDVLNVFIYGDMPEKTKRIISLYLSNATGYVVQEAYKLDFINDMADSIGKSIQTLAGVTENGFSSTGFYVGFLLLIILVVGMYVAYTGLIKRETSKALHAVINFVVVFVLSASFIAYAPDYIKKINEFSSDISTASLDLGTKIMLPNSDSEGKDSVDLIRDSLFSIQVEQPWLNGVIVNISLLL